MPIGLQAQKIKLDMVNAGFDPELWDVRAHIDSSLSFPENRANVAHMLGYQKGTRSNAYGTNPSDMLCRADEFYLAERRKNDAILRKLRGPIPAKRMTLGDFNQLERLPPSQCDDWPYFPTKPYDQKRTALPPGRRLSKTGHIYYERRRNRSDMPGTNL